MKPYCVLRKGPILLYTGRYKPGVRRYPIFMKPEFSHREPCPFLHALCR